MRKHNKETTSHFCFKFAGKIPKSKQLFSVFLKSPIKNTNENWHEIFKFYQQFAPSSHEKNIAWRRGMSVWRLYRQRVPKGCIFHMLSLRLLSDLWSPLGWAGYMMAACVCYYSLSLLALSISSRIKKHCPAFSPAPNSLLLRVDFLSRRWTFHHEPLLDPSLPLRAVLPPALFLKYLPSHSHTYICQGHQQVTPSSSPSRQG